jgi:hypothetical protein
VWRAVQRQQALRIVPVGLAWEPRAGSVERPVILGGVIGVRPFGPIGSRGCALASLLLPGTRVTLSFGRGSSLGPFPSALLASAAMPQTSLLG